MSGKGGRGCGGGSRVGLWPGVWGGGNITLCLRKEGAEEEILKCLGGEDGCGCLGKVIR